MAANKEFSVVDLAEHLRRGFLGWLHTCDTDGPTLGLAVQNRHRAYMGKPTPFGQLDAAIERTKDALNVVEIRTDTPAGKLFQSVYNGGNGILRSSAVQALLVPLAVHVQSPTFPGGVVVCSVAGFVCKTPLYLVLQQDIMRRIERVLQSYGSYTKANLAASNDTVQTYFLRDMKRFKPNDADAFETLLRVSRNLLAPILAAFRAAAVFNQTYADAGSQFKDPAAMSAAKEAIQNAVLSILDTKRR